MRMLTLAAMAAITAFPVLAQYREREPRQPRCVQVCEYRQFCAPIQGCYPIKKCRQRCSR